MRWSCAVIALCLLAPLAFVSPAFAQNVEPNESMSLTGDNAGTWNVGQTNIIQLEGKVEIDIDLSKLTADGAVVWMTPIKGAVLPEQNVEIALVGNAQLTQPDNSVERSGDTLYVTATIRGSIKLSAAKRTIHNLSDSDLYKRAAELRPPQELPAPTTQPGEENWLLQQPWITPSTQPTTQPTTQPAPPVPTSFSANSEEGVKTPDGFVAFILQGNVKLFQRRPDGEFLQLQCERCVLFTPLHSLRERDANQHITKPEEAVRSAYLEGDVRIVHTPSARSKGAEQRLTANRVYYDFTTDRAILTDAVVHTMDVKRNVPLIIRAQTIRQLSEGEYLADKAQLTSSSFATPSYALGLRKAYIRQIETGDPNVGTYSEYEGRGVTIDIYNHPVFYFPYVAGVASERGQVLRQLEITGGSRFGTSFISRYGLFESLGRIPPLNTDITYGFDYYGKRGPAGSLDGHYQGGFINDTLKEPFSFQGDFTAFYVHDTGVDDLGRRRIDVTPPTEDRGRVWLRHQQYLPDDVTVQATLAYVSDPTFLEEWYPEDFFQRGPEDTSLYVKRQKENEAVTFLVNRQFSNFVTSSDFLAEQAEVERLPEIGYRRLGDSVFGDKFTTFSSNTVSALDFRRSRFNTIEEGFTPSEFVGNPAFGTTGEPGYLVYRGDFRQELNYPFTMGQFRVVPYVMARYTAYSNSPDDTAKERLLAGAGVRMSTSYWKVDDTVESRLFDLHRLRHVITPEVNLFTSAANVKRSDVFQYDQSVDEISDITGAQLALHQQWQTKRGGADRWRSVDFFDLNLEADLFTHKPKDSLINPSNFRGLFFDSVPEESLPRNAVNGDATWRVSDTTAVLGDFQYNLDNSNVATASIGVAVQRGDRLSYYVGQRYIKPLESDILTLAAVYQLTTKYQLGIRQSYDFGVSHSVSSGISVIRHFDRFFVVVSARVDEIGNDNGFTINIIPEGLGKAAASGTASIGAAMNGAR